MKREEIIFAQLRESFVYLRVILVAVLLECFPVLIFYTKNLEPGTLNFPPCMPILIFDQR